MFLLIASAVVQSQNIYVNVKTGNDKNIGTNNSPVKTIEKAIEIIDNSSPTGSSVIKIAPGLYSLEKECIIKVKRQFTENNRLIIESELLPGEPGWTPEAMPIITSSQIPERDKPLVEAAGLKIEMDHVTIRGLKFLGSPIPKIFYYPVYREGKSLNDLVISQCMFLADQHILSSNVGVLANGHNLKIDHCVFYGCANSVVYWNADGDNSKGNSMTNCIVDGGYVSGIWLCQTDEDFEFRNNIVTNCKYAFMRSESNNKTYSLDNCIINNYEFYSGRSDDNFNLSETGKEIVYIESGIVKTGIIKLEKGPGLDLDIPYHYMHVLEGSNGYELGAGLFKK